MRFDIKKFLCYLEIKLKNIQITTKRRMAMKLTPQVTFKDVPPSEAIESNILEKAAKLERYYNRIMGCRVAVEAVQQRRHQGKLYSVRIDLTVPGSELVVNKILNEDLYVAIKDAFDAARRKLEAFAEKQRGEVKQHEEPPRGKVTRLVPDEGYGFILTSDGREIYFHKNSVISPEFERLKEGIEVVFVEEQGKKGPQAARVAIAK